MAMTDEERREVARRLRELEVCDYDGEFIDCGEVENVLGLVCDDGSWYEAKGVMRLADLIEPSEPKVRCVAEVKVDGERLEKLAHDTAVELTGIDRDALLALADEIEDVESVMGCVNAANGGWLFVAHRHNDIANRIRETCGEASR